MSAHSEIAHRTVVIRWPAIVQTTRVCAPKSTKSATDAPFGNQPRNTTGWNLVGIVRVHWRQVFIRWVACSEYSMGWATAPDGCSHTMALRFNCPIAIRVGRIALDGRAVSSNGA